MYKEGSFDLRSYINEDIKVGDKVEIKDGSGLTAKNDNEVYYIVDRYPEKTGSPLMLKDMIGVVTEVNVITSISKGVLRIFYLQDIVVRFGKAEFRTASGFVRKL